MKKNEFMQLMQFPKEWELSGMYPDELFQSQLSTYKPGHEKSSEHDRNGAFHWWLKKGPNRSQLEQLLALAKQDPDKFLSRDVLKRIEAAIDALA